MKRIGIMAGIVLAVVVLLDLAIMVIPQKPNEEAETETAALTREEEEAQEERLDEIAHLIDIGQTDEALGRLQELDPQSVEYYMLKEMALVEDGSEKANENLSQMYLEASDVYPEWEHMQKMAGAACIYSQKYDAAAYRLTEALYLDAEDPEIWYYLGVLAYHEKNHDEMAAYFDKALEYGLDDSKKERILWYAQQEGDLQ